MTELFGVPIQALLGQLMLGLVNGSFYAILSLGLAVIFGMLNIVNFAHGALFMMGAFVSWMLLNYLGMMAWSMPDEREKFTLDEMVAAIEKWQPAAVLLESIQAGADGHLTKDKAVEEVVLTFPVEQLAPTLWSLVRDGVLSPMDDVTRRHLQPAQ